MVKPDLNKATLEEIIKIIENQMQSNVAHPNEEFYSNTYSYRLGQLDALRDLSRELQLLIEE
jgi:hypothetical protein